MKFPTLSVLAAACALMALPAMAEEQRCDVPEAERQPETALRTRLEADGWKIARVKVENGCYEVYAHDAQGKKVEALFDPRTLTRIADETEE